MKKHSLIFAVLTMLMVTLCSLYVTSCKDDDELNKDLAPQYLTGAWKANYAGPELYEFNENGTGKLYYGVDYSENTAQGVSEFRYIYNPQNLTLTLDGVFCNLTFRSENTTLTMTLSRDGRTWKTLSSAPWIVTPPSVSGNNSGSEQGGNSSGQAPSTPTNVTATVSGTSITISWQSVSGANSYNIYRSSSANGTYSQIGTSTSSSFRDNSPISGYNYYKISSVNDKGESQQSNYTYCNYTSGGGSATIPNAPTNVSATNVGNDYLPNIQISWSAVSNATSYLVYRSSTAYGTYTQIGSSTLNTYMYDSNPLSGNNYYKVKAANSAGTSSYSSYAYYNNDVEYKPCPPTVNVSGTTSQTVTWSNSTGSTCGTPTSYEVYKQNPFTNEWELKKTTTSKSYSPPSSDIHPGENWYGVKAINNSGSSVMMPAHSEGGSTLARPSTFTAEKYGSSVKFTWSKVTWATGYQIFSSSSANGNYYILDEISDGSQTTYTRYYPASGTTEYFKICTVFQGKWGGRFYSDFSTYKRVAF